MFPTPKRVLLYFVSISLISLSSTCAMEPEEGITFNKVRPPLLHASKEVKFQEKEEHLPHYVEFTTLTFDETLHPHTLPVALFLNSLAGEEPTFLSRLNYLLQYTVRGWGAVRMGRSSYQVIMMSGSLGGDAPQNAEEGRAWARNLIESIENSPPAAMNRSDRALFFVTHEFAANGRGTSGNGLEYSAKYPISIEAYEGIRAEISQWIKDKPKGINIILGGTAIDTGEVVLDEYGKEKKLGKNVGFVATGRSSELLEIRKRFEAPQDGWKEAEFTITQEGEGYTTVPIEKIIPNWDNPSDYFAISICLDASKTGEVNIPREPAPAMYFICGAEAPPPSWIIPTDPNTTKIIIDINQFEDPTFGAAKLNGGLYELSENYSPSFIKKLFMTAKKFWTITPEQVDPSLRSYIEAGKFRLLFKETGCMLITEPRDIPITISERDILNLENRIIEKQAIVMNHCFDGQKSDDHSDSPDEWESLLREESGGSHEREVELEQRAERHFGGKEK